MPAPGVDRRWRGVVDDLANTPVVRRPRKVREPARRRNRRGQFLAAVLDDGDHREQLVGVRYGLADGHGVDVVADDHAPDVVGVGDAFVGGLTGRNGLDGASPAVENAVANGRDDTLTFADHHDVRLGQQRTHRLVLY